VTCLGALRHFGDRTDKRYPLFLIPLKRLQHRSCSHGCNGLANGSNVVLCESNRKEPEFVHPMCILCATMMLLSGLLLCTHLGYSQE